MVMLSILPLVWSLDNGAARRPPLGWSNWNRWQNRINSSIFRETAQFMRDSGLLAAGFEYVTLGGIGYANGSSPGGNITRNASGHLQSDPIRFPGGNDGMCAAFHTPALLRASRSAL